MGLAEKIQVIAASVREQISPKRAHGEAANDAIFEFVPINLDDLDKQGVWKNAEGDRLRVNANTLTMMSYTGGGQEVFYDSAKDILHILTEGKYVLVPAAPKAERVTEEHDESQIADQEQVDQERAQQVLARLRKIPTEESDLRPKAPVIATIVSAKGQFPSKRASKKGERDGTSGRNKDTPASGADQGGNEFLVIDRIAEESQSMQQLIESVQAQSGQDTSGAVRDLLEDILGDKVILDEDIARVKQNGGKNRKELADLDERCKVLFGRAVDAQQALALFLSQPAPAASRGEDGPQTTPAPTSTGEAPRTSEDDKLTDRKTAFRKVLDETWDLAVADISAIATPEAYATFRRENMFTPILKNGEPSPVRCIVDADKVSRSLGAEGLNAEEFREVTGDFEKALGRELLTKFSTLKKDDLMAQSKIWGAMINSATDVAQLEALLATWSQEDPVSSAWQAVMNDLGDHEKSFVKEDYAKRRAEFEGAVHWEIFRRQHERASQVYHGIITGERDRFEDFASRLQMTEEMGEQLWEETLFPKMRESILGDMIAKRGLDSEKAEKVWQGFSRELKRKIQRQRREASK